MQQKIVISGGPGTGKSTIINFLKSEGHQCLEEVSRHIILDAQKKGIDLFSKDPMLFSNLILDARISQFHEAERAKKELVFFDRGLPDVFAYLNYIDIKYPNHFIDQSEKHLYHKVFLTPPWKEIYTNDNERYENFEQSKTIHTYIKQAYEQLGYKPIIIPTGTIEERVAFIFKNL